MQRSESFAVCLYVYQGAFYANYFLITQTFSMACIIVNRSKKNQPVSRPPVVRNTALQREGFRGFPDIEFGRFFFVFLWRIFPLIPHSIVSLSWSRPHNGVSSSFHDSSWFIWFNFNTCNLMTKIWTCHRYWPDLLITKHIYYSLWIDHDMTSP